jgi:two-component sensor histidine kinase
MAEYERNNRVLYVDDEKSLLSAFISLLRKEDIETHVLNDSTRIQNVLEQIGPFAVVFSDQRMPLMDGVGVLEVVARTHPSTLRVMMSGFSDFHELARAVNVAGLTSFISKPWKDGELIRFTRDCVERFNVEEEKSRLRQLLGDSYTHLQRLLDGSQSGNEPQELDSTEVVESLRREKVLMLKEIYHRVMNNLQVISSMLSLQAGRDADPAAQKALRRAVERIHAIAGLHGELYRSSDLSSIDFTAYLRSQVAQGGVVLRLGEIDLVVDGDSTAVGIDVAVPLGLMCQELISNALTHAFLGRQSGQVKVTIRSENGSGLSVEIADDGKGMGHNASAGENPHGLGLLLVDTLATQVGATIQRSDAAGTSYLIKLQLPGNQ